MPTCVNEIFVAFIDIPCRVSNGFLALDEGKCWESPDQLEASVVLSFSRRVSIGFPPFYSSPSHIWHHISHFLGVGVVRGVQGCGQGTPPYTGTIIESILSLRTKLVGVLLKSALVSDCWKITVLISMYLNTSCCIPFQYAYNSHCWFKVFLLNLSLIYWLKPVVFVL